MHPPLIRTSTVPAAFQHLSVAWPHQKEHPVRMPAACLIEKIGANGPTLKIHFRQRGRVKKWRHSMMPCLAGHCNALDTQNTKFRNAVPHHMSWNVIGKWLRHFGSREFSVASSAGPASQLPFPLQFLHLHQLRATSWGALKSEGNLLRKSPAHLQTLICKCISIHADVLILSYLSIILEKKSITYILYTDIHRSIPDNPPVSKTSIFADLKITKSRVAPRGFMAPSSPCRVWTYSIFRF